MIIEQQHILNKDTIFLTVQQIEKEFQKESKKTVAVVFKNSHTLIFIDPLFFILLLNIYDKYILQGKILVIDIMDLDMNQQYYVHRFLFQYEEFNYFHSRTKRKENQLDSVERREDIYENSPMIYNLAKDIVTEGHLFFYNTQNLKKDSRLEILKSNNKPGFLPILKITNLQDMDSIDIYDEERKLFYNQLIANDRNSIIEVCNNLLNNHFASKPLSDIFYEIFDNIKKHTHVEKTNTYANGHICFYHNSAHKKYELLITDDFTGGFLNRYKQTLNEEKKIVQDLQQSKKDENSKEILIEYDREIDYLNKDGNIYDKKIAEELFDINNSFGMHQVPRIIMHFGIPTLLKMLQTLNGKLSIYFSRNSRYYKINFIGYKPNFFELINGIEGTYYYIEFPSNLPDIKIESFTQHKLENIEYKIIFEERKKIQKQIDDFHILTYKNMKKNINYNNKSIVLPYEKNIDETIGEYLRHIYRYAYLNEITDILILNFPIQEFSNYLDILSKIIYHDSSNYQSSLNIVFLDKNSISSIFLGGKDKDEFNAVNNLIAQKKQYNKTISLNENSKLFIRLDEKIIFIPFELFSINKELLLPKIIANNLLSNKLSIHVNTQQDYHIDGFFQFRKIFEDSQWVHRIAFYLAIEIEKNKAVYIIGTDKYANLAISLAYSYLDIHKNYSILNDYSKSSLSNLQNRIKKQGDILIYSSVLFSGKKIVEKIIPLLKDDHPIQVNAIKININNNIIKNLKSLVNINLNASEFENIKEKACSKCTSGQESVLYKLSSKNNFMLEDFYDGIYKNKKIISQDKYYVDFFDSVYFGHTTRENNHYNYYTQTVKFYCKNIKRIKLYLDDLAKSFKDKIQNKKIIIFSPLHNTNSMFLSLVNSIVFKNNAIIHQYDKSNSEQNFYDLKDIEIDNDTLVYFVDDEISSGSTFEYFYTLLNTIKNEAIRFNGIIALVDRTSIHEEQKIIQLVDNITSIHFYSRLEIRPIKTEFEECFLCKKRDSYIKMFDNTTLDMNRYQLAKRILKLNKKNFDDIDIYNETNFETKIRTFIKMNAIDFVYKNFKLFKDNKIETYDNMETDFKTIILEKIELSISINKKLKAILNKICEYEAEIALLKALTFPKLVYYKNIREIVTKVLIQKIKNYLFGENNPTEKIIFEVNTFLDDDEKKLLNNLNLNNSKFKYIDSFKNKTNIDSLNFLYITSSYLNINMILDYASIECYYKIVCEVKDKKNNLNNDLLHMYPSAVKLVSSYSNDKSKYFLNQLDLFRRANRSENIFSREWQMINSLHIENTYIPNIECFEIKNDIEKEKTLDDKLKSFFEQIEKPFNNVKLEKPFNNVKLEKICINENFNLKYDSYKDYLNASKLRDVKNNFETTDNASNKIDMLYKGAITDTCEDDIILKENDTNNINNTWLNTYYRDNNKMITIIKIVDINSNKLNDITTNNELVNNKNIWFKPMGCVVVSHADSYQLHLDYARYISINQIEIIKFFKEELSHQAFKEAILRKEFEDTLSVYNHTTGSMFDIGSKITFAWEKLQYFCETNQDKNLNEFDDFNKLAKYMYGVSRIGRIGQLKRNKNKRIEQNKSLYNILDAQLNNLNNFFEVYGEEENIEVDIKISENTKLIVLPLKRNDIVIIFFELFFNAVKYSKLKKCTIEVDFIDNVLRIKNDRMKKHRNNATGLGIAHKYIKDFFYDINYNFDTIESNDFYEVLIQEVTNDRI